MSVDERSAAVVLVHGLFSGPSVWDGLAELLSRDPTVNAAFYIKRFSYDSPKIQLNPLKRIPSFKDLASHLALFLENEQDLRRCSRIALVGHSQGGLLIQYYLAMKLREGRAADLQRVRGVVLIATPNTGSQLLLTLRRWFDSLRIWRHAQERQLRPHDEELEEVRKTVLEDAIYAVRQTDKSCPIRFDVFAGESDAIVPPESAKWVFPRAASLPGDHFSVVRPTTAGSEAFTVLVAALRRVLHSVPPDATTIVTEALDPTNDADVKAVMELQGHSFLPGASIKEAELRYWLENYQPVWALHPSLVVAKVDGQVKGFLMLHESRDLIIIDYVAVARDQAPLRLLLAKLVNQVRRRARDLDNPPVVFEVEDPRLQVDPAKATARIKRFQQLHARLVSGFRMLAPDMETLKEGDETPYLLMYARPGMMPDTLTRDHVIGVIQTIYTVWYRNWFSRRTGAAEAAAYLERLCDRVCATVPAVCTLSETIPG